MRFSVLASGSRGNAFYVEGGGSRVLIDAGLSGRAIEARLKAIGREARDLTALVLSHEHQDHVLGAGILARRYHLPLYANPLTCERAAKALGRIPDWRAVATGDCLQLNDLGVETFTKCHDAADPMGFVLSAEGVRLGLVTDLGRVTRLVEDRLRLCQGLILEFNHDPDLLEAGPYPLYLKRRIKGPDGHLSNGQGADLLRALWHTDLRQVVLAHLSAVNNHPDQARDAALRALADAGAPHIRLDVSLQAEPLPLTEVG